MPRFREMERSGKSLIWSFWKELRYRAESQKAKSGARWNLFVSLPEGMQGLVEAMSQKLPAESFHLGVNVTNLEWAESSSRWTIHTSGKTRWQAEAVILALPAFVAGGLLSRQFPELSEDLCEIPYVSTATVTLAYRKSDIPHPVDAFGFLVPAVESREVFACTFSSVKFPNRAPEEMALLRAFIGGALQPQLLNQSNQEMVTMVRKELAALLGVQASPVMTVVHRHELAMPQYHTGHGARVQRIESRLARISRLGLAGNAYRGVGIPDCVHSGEQAAESVLRQLEFV